MSPVALSTISTRRLRLRPSSVELGATGLSFPILNDRGTVVAALTLGGPTSRFTEDRIPKYIDYTRVAAEAISALGLPGLD